VESTEGKVPWSMAAEMRQQLEEMRDRWSRIADRLERYDAYAGSAARMCVAELERAVRATDPEAAAQAVERFVDLATRLRPVVAELRAAAALYA